LTHAVWIAASLLFALFGIAPASVDRAARLAIRFATGIVIGGTVMYLESLLGIPWTRIGLAMPMLLIAIWSAAAMPPLSSTQKSGGVAAALQIGTITLLTIYGIATARMTCGDLLYFWAPKAQHFFFAQKIDTEFLKFPHYYLMHPDYPPLLPMVYTWCSIAAHHFSYWGAAFLTPLYLLAAVLAFRGFAAQKIGERRATASATLLAAVLAFGFAEGHTAGGADPQLVMFEVIALAAPRSRKSKERRSQPSSSSRTRWFDATGGAHSSSLRRRSSCSDRGSCSRDITDCSTATAAAEPDYTPKIWASFSPWPPSRRAITRCTCRGSYRSLRWLSRATGAEPRCRYSSRAARLFTRSFSTCTSPMLSGGSRLPQSVCC